MMPAYIWDCGVPIAGLRLYDMCHSFVIPCGASDDEDDKSYNDEDTDGCVLHCSAFLIHGSVFSPPWASPGSRPISYHYHHRFIYQSWDGHLMTMIMIEIDFWKVFFESFFPSQNVIKIFYRFHWCRNNLCLFERFSFYHLDDDPTRIMDHVRREGAVGQEVKTDGSYWKSLHAL